MSLMLKPTNVRQQERARQRELRLLRLKVRQLESSQSQQRPYRATPNTEGVDPGTP